MTKENFDNYWTSTYPKTVPLSHLFRHHYGERWFRIHSLPKSKRYPDNSDDWTILLKRQNKIITDLFGENAEVLLITGEYNWGQRKNYITDEEAVFKPYKFLRLDHIDLFKLNAEEFDEGEIYRPSFAETIWIPHRHDTLLKEIAEDKTRAFFVSIDKEVIIAPYDGGIDFVLKDSDIRAYYKEKYREWLSEREDGY